MGIITSALQEPRALRATGERNTEPKAKFSASPTRRPTLAETQSTLKYRSASERATHALGILKAERAELKQRQLEAKIIDGVLPAEHRLRALEDRAIQNCKQRMQFASVALNAISLGEQIECSIDHTKQLAEREKRRIASIDRLFDVSYREEHVPTESSELGTRNPAFSK